MKRFEVLALCTAFVALAGCSGSIGSTPAPGPSGAPPPKSAIQHIVILLQENRSFNNIFAGFPGADTALEGPCLPAAWCKGSHTVKLQPVLLESYKGGDEYEGKDIDHSHNGFKIECNANNSNVCQNDGFGSINLGESGQEGPAKTYPYAYVERSETAPYWALAKQYALADKMFFTETASSFIAHQSILTGSVVYNSRSSLTDQPALTPWGCDAPGFPTGPHQLTFTPLLFTNGKETSQGPFPCFDWPATIADLLDARSVSWHYYVDSWNNTSPNFDFSGAVWDGVDAVKKIACPTYRTLPSGIACHRGPDWKNVSMPNTNVFSDVKAGTLPSVSWVIPTAMDSDHPASGCNGGPWWVTRVVNAIGTSQYWKNTAIILLWDDWGGWYDPVPPPQVTYTRLGFRVGLLLISPYAKPGSISKTQYDFGSILKYIEQTFGLGSLGTTDTSANSLADMLNLEQTPNKFKPAPLPKPLPCAKLHVGGDAMRRMIEHDGGIPE